MSGARVAFRNGRQDPLEDLQVVGEESLQVQSRLHVALLERAAPQGFVDHIVVLPDGAHLGVGKQRPAVQIERLADLSAVQVRFESAQPPQVMASW